MLPSTATLLLSAPMVVFTLLSLLYPLAVKATFEMLHCKEYQVPFISTLGLDPGGVSLTDSTLQALFASSDGGESSTAGGADGGGGSQGNLVYSLIVQDSPVRRSLQALYSVSLLFLDPYFVCFKGQHRGPGAVAILCLVLYVSLYPFVALWLLLRWYNPGPGNSGYSNHKMATPRNSNIIAMKNSVSEIPSQVVKKQQRSDKAARALSVAGSLNTHAPLAADGAARSTTYTDARRFFLQLDLVALFLLTALLVFWPSPSSASEAGGKLFMTVTILLPTAAAFLLLNPWSKDDVWKLVAKLCSLLLALMSAVLSCTQVVSGPQSREAASLSHVVIILSALVFVLIVVAFWMALMDGAAREAHDMIQRALHASGSGGSAVRVGRPQKTSQWRPPQQSGGGASLHRSMLQHNQQHLPDLSYFHHPHDSEPRHHHPDIIQPASSDNMPFGGNGGSSWSGSTRSLSVGGSGSSRSLANIEMSNPMLSLQHRSNHTAGSSNGSNRRLVVSQGQHAPPAEIFQTTAAVETQRDHYVASEPSAVIKRQAGLSQWKRQVRGAKQPVVDDTSMIRLRVEYVGGTRIVRGGR